jgi:hypothetical protein
MTSDIELRKPSKLLIERIGRCADEFKTAIKAKGSLQNAINAAYEQGKIEGFTREDISSMIRKEIIGLGFSDRTVRRNLPADLKRTYTLTPSQGSSSI